MNKQINLMVAKQQEKRGIRKSFLVSVISLFVVIIFSFITMIYDISLSNQYGNLYKKEQDTITRLNSLTKKKSKLLRLNDRLDEYKKVENARMKLGDRMVLILSILPEDLKIDTIKFYEKTLKLKLYSKSLYEISKVTDEIEQPAKVYAGVDTIKLDSIQYNPYSGEYEFNISFILI